MIIIYILRQLEKHTLAKTNYLRMDQNTNRGALCYSVEAQRALSSIPERERERERESEGEREREEWGR